MYTHYSNSNDNNNNNDEKNNFHRIPCRANKLRARFARQEFAYYGQSPY